MIEQILSTISQVPSLKKGDRNQHGGYNYVSIDDYYEKVAKIAAANGVTWKSREISSEVITVGEKADRNGNVVPVLALKTKYEFDVLAGHETLHTNFFSCTILHPLQGAQTAGSSLSYADKLFMRTVFKVVTGEGDADASDSNAFDQFFEEAPKKPKPKGLTHSIETTHTKPSTPVPVLESEGEDPVSLSEFMKNVVETFLPMATTNEELVDFWNHNEHNFEALKSEDADTYKVLVAAFKRRRKSLSGGTD